MSNSWTSRCPSCDQTLLPRWKVWTWRFWKTFGRTGWGIVAWWEFFYMLWLVVMVVWWVRRNWWDGSAQSQTIAGLTLLPHHDSPRLKHSFLPRVEILWWTLQNLFTTRCFLKEQSVHGHVTRFEKKFDKENWKTLTFIFQNTCFPRPACTGSGRRSPALQFVKNSYGVVSPPVDRGHFLPSDFRLFLFFCY